MWPIGVLAFLVVLVAFSLHPPFPAWVANVLDRRAARRNERESRRLAKATVRGLEVNHACKRCGVLLEGSQLPRGTCAPCSVRKFA